MKPPSFLARARNTCGNKRRKGAYTPFDSRRCCSKFFVPKSPSWPCFGGRMVRPVRGAFVLYRSQTPSPPLCCARLLLQRACCRRHRTRTLLAEVNWWWLLLQSNSEMAVAPPRPSPSSSTSGSATRGSGSDPPGPTPPVRHLGAGAHARRGLLVNGWLRPWRHIFVSPYRRPATGVNFLRATTNERTRDF